MLTLYYTFWLMFLIFILIYFIISAIINFFKLNSLKTLFTIYFQKENKFIIITSLIFTIFFWFLFYSIFYIRNYPSLRITENIKKDNSFEVSSSSFNITTNTKKENLNITLDKDILFEIVSYSRKSVTLKFKENIYFKKCDTCSMNFLEENKEYKLKLNDLIYLELIDNDIDNQVYYVIDLYK